MADRQQRRAQRFFLASLCVFGVMIYAFIESYWTGNRGADFNQFYSAARLAGTGRLYDWDALQQLERRNYSSMVPYIRVPLYAYLFKPIAWLPWQQARVVWWLVNALAIASLPWLWPFPSRWMSAAVLCWSLPVWALLNWGQDTALFLWMASAGAKLMEKNRPFVAGLVFALCASKFHLAVGIPVVLLAQRRWRVLTGGLAGGAVIAAACFLIEGPGWPQQLLTVVRTVPDVQIPPERMVHIAAFFERYNMPASLAIALSLGVLLVLWRTPNAGILWAALPAGLLVTPHSFVYDSVVLVPALLFAVTRCGAPLCYWAILLMLPVPYSLIMFGNVAGQLAIIGFSLALLLHLAFRKPSAVPTPAVIQVGALTKSRVTLRPPDVY